MVQSQSAAPVSANVPLDTPEAHTAGAVLAVDQRWDDAEESSNISYLGGLLLPEYRSVNLDGSSTDKPAIIQRASHSSSTRIMAIRAWKG